MKLRNKMIKALLGGELVFFLVCMLISQGAAQQMVTEFPIATTAGWEMSASAAFDGTNYLVGMEGGDTNNKDEITDRIVAQLVSQSGTLVGSRISVGRTGAAPFVAFDGTNYLLVWADSKFHQCDNICEVIYGQLISKSGTLIGSPFPISPETGNNMQWEKGYRIIFDGTNYFVVWDYGPRVNGCKDEYGQFVTPSGTLLGQPIKINTAPCHGGGAVVAFDGANILVAWGSEWNASGTQSVCWTDSSGYHCGTANIWGQFITKSSAGTPGTFLGSNFLISAASVLYSLRSIAFGGTNYLVGFEQETTRPDACPSNGCKWDVYGQLVSTAGAPIGSKIIISDTDPDHIFPGPIFDGTNYLVMWTEGFGSTEATVKGRFFNKSGSPASSEFTLFSPSDDRVPWLGVGIFDGSKYFLVVNRGAPGSDPFDLMTYTNQDVYGAFTNPLPLIQYTLTVTKADTGGGTVKSSPAGINCGDDCSETYSKVQKVKLTARADTNSSFVGWSGECSGTKTCTVTVDAAVIVTADFVLKTPDIYVAQTSIEFGSMKVGKKVTKTLKITNNGSGDLLITLSGLEGTDFSIQGSSGVTIKAKKSYSLKVLFTPTSAGLETATLKITSNDPDTPTIDISLGGTGQ